VQEAVPEAFHDLTEGVLLKVSYLSIVAAALVVAALFLAGCSMMNPGGSAQTSSGNTGTTGAAQGGNAAAAPAAASGGTCPAVTSATSWTGKWDTWANGDVCYDGREKFYPVTDQNPNPWDGVAGDIQPQGSFTQTGCDVTGSWLLGDEGVITSPHGCPITFTGKVDSNGALSGTWKAYCNFEFSGTDATPDNGIFSLNMEPGGSTFVGRFMINDPDLNTYISNTCPNANSNWVGKRA